MIRQKYDITIDGVSIRSLSPLIRVTNITENAPRIEQELEPHPALAGQLVLGNYRREFTVQVGFVLAEIFDLQARAEAIDAVNGWAKAGRLELSYRPNRMLQVDAVTERPNVAKIKEYTQEYTLSFTAYSFPYWVDVLPISAAGSGTSGTIELRQAGTLPAFLEATITPTGGTLTGFSLASSGGTSLIVSGCNVAADTPITLEYNAQHFQLLHAGSTDLRPYITPASNDHVLILPDAVNTITFTANVATTFNLSARGVFA